MKKRLLLPSGLVAGLLALSGCTSTPNTVENASKEGQRNIIADQRVITDESLNRSVNVVAVNTLITPDGLLKVQIELQNHTDSLQRFLYHFEWFDGNGMQVNNALSASVPEQIEGQEDKFISGIAPSPYCRDFRVKFIAAN
jgi:uncharacterized protein YcfL